MNHAAAWRVGAPALLALLALAQMSVPVSAGAGTMLVPLCSLEKGRAIPLRLPGKNDGSDGAACGKICHSAMRKRFGADTSMGGEDDADAR